MMQVRNIVLVLQKSDKALEQIYFLSFFLIISFKSPLFPLAYFYEIQMTFPESASITLSYIQSTAKYIFLKTP